MLVHLPVVVWLALGGDSLSLHANGGSMTGCPRGWIAYIAQEGRVRVRGDGARTLREDRRDG